MITPLEIQNKEFNKSIRGYNIDEVEGFLDKVLESYGNIYRENIELKDKVRILTEQIDRYDNLEDTLKNTLVMAQTTADGVTKTAREKSKNIIEEAELKVKEMEWKSELKLEKILNDYDNIRTEMILFKNKYISFLESQLASIEEFSNTEDIKEIEENMNNEVDTEA